MSESRRLSSPHMSLGGLRSAMKQPSRPSTPSSPPSSPPQIPVPLLGRTYTSSSTVAPSSLLSPGYTPKVSFDTFENPAASMFSFTLHVQSDGYRRNRQTRVFLCAASPDESGSQALDWVLESLVQDGDELIVVRGFDTDELVKDHDILREEAKELMRFTQDKSVEYDPDRKLSIIIEFIAGKVTETIERLIALYRPDSLIVGTKGQRGVIQAWGAAFGAPGMGSVSKYCLSHSPVPVIVVRPERKVRQSKEKRRADPKRGLHFEQPDKSRSNITSVPMTPTLTQ